MYRVVGAMDGDHCPAEAFLAEGPAQYFVARRGLSRWLEEVAKGGLEQLPAAASHEVNKRERIYEFIKGDLRLFYFKGKNGDVAVCCGGVVKKGQKADAQSVARAIRWKKAYEQAVKDGSYELIPIEENTE